MMIFILANWRWLIPTAAAAGLAAMLGLARFQIADLKAAAAETALAIQTQKTDAQRILAEAQEHARQVEASYAALNIQLEKDHADAGKKLDGARGDNDKLAARVGLLLRQQAGRGTCGSGNLPSTADASRSDPGGAAPGGFPGAVEGYLGRISELFREADGTAEVGSLCHAWAMSIGK